MKTDAAATQSPARCPVTPDTALRLVAAGLSSFGTEGAALEALAAAGDVLTEGAPDCMGKHGTTPWCDGCVWASPCNARRAGRGHRRRPPPAAGQ